MVRRLCGAALLGLIAPAMAQPQQVEVKADRDASARSDSIGAVVMVKREQLLQHGDTRLADALRRVPGLTVVNGGPRGTELRMAGLGGGYTQILLNGEPVPPGFALESLAPEAVERVEILRSTGVEQSSQAIAGSINIVLRSTPRSAQRDFKLGAGSQWGRPSASADLLLGRRSGTLDWGLTGGLEYEPQRFPIHMDQRTLDSASGGTTQAYRTDKLEFDRSLRLTLTPRASWVPADGQRLTTDHLWRAFRSRYGAQDERDSETGALPQYRHNTLYFKIHGWNLRSRAGWTLEQPDGTKWELKLGLTEQRRDSQADFDGFNFSGTWIRDAHVASLASDHARSLNGRWRRPWQEAHTLAAGWDAESSGRTEDRVQVEQPLPGGLPVENLDERYDARVRRLALFVQDEWEAGRGWTATLGLRWEGLVTDSEGNVFDAVHQRSSVFSPVLQTVWRVPNSKDQLRLALARSYKAPTPRELMPRRFVANSNSPTTPDQQGNPELKPELAWGLDAGWEQTPRDGVQLSLNTFVKRIEAVVVEQLLLQNGAWVARRANNGVAWVQGIEAELRLAARKVWPAAAALDLRANVAFNGSRVVAAPGPDNRLAQQVPRVANLGWDHRIDDSTLSWGGTLNLQAGSLQRLDAVRWQSQAATRTLDLYASGRTAAGATWRVALGNALQGEVATARRVLDSGSDYRLEERLRTAARLRFTWQQAL